MASTSLPRLALRQSRIIVQRRAASTTSEVANAAASGASKATGAAQETAAKAQQGLSRVTSSASSTLTNAATAAGNTLSSVGGRTGQAVTFVQSLIPPTIYYARVTGELAKLIYTGRAMQPPTVQTLQTYLTPIQNAVRNPSALASKSAQVAGQTADKALTSPQSFITRLRDLDHAALTTVAVVAAETIGFFSIGEIIGRFKIIGYHGETHSHH